MNEKKTATQRRNARRRRGERARTKSQELRGYRLHDARIEFSGGLGSMRTVKVELLNPDSSREDPQRGQGLQGKVAKAVFDDYRALYGPMNIEDYLSDPDCPSFLGLWVKAVCLGVIMSRKTATDFGELRGGSKSGQAFDSIPEHLRRQLIKLKWLDWYDKGIRKSSSKASRLKSLTDVFANPKQPDQGVMAAWEQGEKLAESSRDIAALGRREFKDKLFAIPPPTSSVVLDDDVKATKVSRDWQWAVDPQFKLPSTDLDITRALEEVDRQWFERLGNNRGMVQQFFAIGDNGNHLNNGLFGHFFASIRSANLADIVAEMGTAFGFSAEERDIVRQRLETLHEYAQGLPEKPVLASRWAEYRTDMTAKLGSWYSNRTSKGAASITQVWGTINTETGEVKDDGLVRTLENIQSDLPDSCSIKEGILQETLDFIGDRRSSTDRAFTDELELYLATLRSDLNTWCQEQSALWEEKQRQVATPASDEKSKKADNPWAGKGSKTDKWLGALHTRIQSSPLFWGVDKLELWKTLANLKQAIRDEIDKLNEQVEVFGRSAYDEPVGKDADSGEGDRRVDQLSYLSARLGDQAHEEVRQRLDAIALALGVKFSERDDLHRFFVSSRARRRAALLAMPNTITVGKLRELADLTPLWERIKKKPEEPRLLADTVALSKVVNSACASRANPSDQIELTTIHSRLDGYSKNIGHTEFISRATVQSTNGAQNTVALDSLVSPRLFYYNFPNIVESAEPHVSHLEVATRGNLGSFEEFAAKEHRTFDRENPQKDSRNRIDSVNPLAVASSRYQIQFFTWWAGLHRSKETALEVGGSFTIAERQVRLDWSQEKPQAVVSEELRVFVSQPFTIVPDDKKRPATSGTRYIGVDIGEYGLAWSCWEFAPGYWNGSVVNPSKVTCLDYGFLAEPGQRRIVERVKKLRESQATKTFTSPDTYIARLRENVVATYQAQLEALMMAYNAQLVFESEISAFETGGNRVKKIYDAIKRSSVFGRSDAEATDNNQHWGKNGNRSSVKDPDKLRLNEAGQVAARVPWAEPVSAWMTSQTCSACGRVYVRAYRGKNSNEPDSGATGEVRYFDNKQQKILTKTIGADTVWVTDQERKEFERGVYNAMRPNAFMPDGRWTAAGEILEAALKSRGTLDGGRGFAGLHLTSKAQVHEYIEGTGKSHRDAHGNSAIFICPYTDCGHIADADLQASYNIALRGFAYAIVRKKHPELFAGSGSSTDGDEGGGKKPQQKQAFIDEIVRAAGRAS